MNNKWKINRDVVTVAIAGLVMITLWGVLAGFFWALFWAGILLWLGLVEYLAWRKTGRAISQHFADLLRTRPSYAWLLITSLVAILVWLIIHFYALR